MSAPLIYKAIQSIMRDVCAIGVGKDSRNKDQGFNFRGIEAAMNALAPLMVKHGVVCIPRHTDSSRHDRMTKNGGVMSFVTTDSEFDLVCVDDGSIVTVKTKGEGMDMSDKGTNKAMSSAFKYALFQTFVVPTMAVDVDETDGGMSDLDAEVARQNWITRCAERMKASTATADTLRNVWKQVKAECEEQSDREAAEELLSTYKKLAAEIVDRQSDKGDK